MEWQLKQLQVEQFNNSKNLMLIEAIILSAYVVYLLVEYFSLFKNKIMKRNINWHQIIYSSDQEIPCKRWGHKTVFIEDENMIVLFGGFSDVTYLNDLWVYNIHTNKWKEIATKGNKPQGKSNFTMHYDNVTNQLLIFGGGGPNKRRYNNLSMLNWSTKEWSEFQPELINGEQAPIPWERTYHSSEFKYPYLITFGGEGAANIDLDDLWVFNVETRKWSELQTRVWINEQNNNSIVRIQGRKFHSTTMIDSKLFVVSGCKMNYACVSSIYSVDLAMLFQSENNGIQQNIEQHNLNQQQLIVTQQKQYYKWKIHPIQQKQLQLIQKWGHSSQSYNGKIYIFGGRNQEDSNDIVQFNPVSNKLTKLNPSRNEKLPKSRRRHSSCMIGSSMVVFGGFNLQYFNDLQYISLFECRDTLDKENYTIDSADYELIELQDKMFRHFMEEISKEKPGYDIELLVETIKHKEPIVVRSSSTLLKMKSAYFANCLLYNHETNPQRKILTIPLQSLGVSLLAFQMFNVFVMKDMLILPKDCKLKKLYELLICADYFQEPQLFNLIQNLLTLKVIDSEQDLDDIFNIAANWNMQSMLLVCAERKILNKTYFNSCSKVVSISHKAAGLKKRYIEEMLMEVQFDEIQKCHNSRHTKQLPGFGKHCSVQLKGLSYIKYNDITRKKSLMQKFIESFSKFYSSGSQQEVREMERQESYQSDDEQEEDNITGQEIKMY